MIASQQIRTAVLTALFLVFSQFLFWPAVHYAEQISRPAQIDQRPSIELEALDSNRNVIHGGKRYTARRQRQQGYYAPLVPGVDYVRFYIPFKAVADSHNLGLYMSLRDDVVEIRLNNIIILPEVTVSRQQGSLNVGPQYVPLPPAVVRKGENILSLDVRSTGTVNDFPTFSIGDAENLSSAHRWRNMFALDLPLAGVAVLVFTVLLCAVIDWPKDDRPRIRAIMLLLSLSAVSTAVLSYIPQDWPFTVTIGIYVFSSAGIGLSALQYAQSDGQFAFSSGRLIRWSWLALPVLIAIPLLLTNFEPAIAPKLISGMLEVSFWFVSVLCVIAATMLAAATVRSGWSSWLERLLLILCFSFFALDRLGSIFELHSLLDRDVPLTLPWSPIVGVPLGLSIILSLAKQATEARKTVTQSNGILAAKLIEQSAELDRSYDAQKQMLHRQVVLEERQRIVRDMHDGIGGQLLGLMMQVRNGGVDKIEVEQGLQSSLADLRLIVDSMDSAEDGLAETLRSFEHRVRAQVEAAGMAFEVKHGLNDGLPGPGPRPTLQILRILQEAVTNAMRHSGGNAISLSSAYTEEGAIVISIGDNGRGIPDAVQGGRGLINMRTRALAVGGQLEIHPQEVGTLIRFVIPGTKLD